MQNFVANVEKPLKPKSAMHEVSGEINKDAKFCGECGTKQVTEKTCAKCGKVNARVRSFVATVVTICNSEG